MTPKKIALLTDSSADLRWDQARENNIFFVPLRILCEDGEYLDGVNITGPDIYQRLLQLSRTTKTIRHHRIVPS